MKPIVCRANPRILWIVAPGVLMSLAFIFGPSCSQPPEDRVVIILGIVAGLLFLALCAYLAIDTLRRQVRADEKGLCWREGFGGWKSARWDEISDFYVLGSQNGTPIVETPHGELWLSNRIFGIGDIADLVPQRAATAKAREWEVRDYRRDEEWEQTLPVWTKAQVWAAPLWTAAALYLIGYFAFALLFGPKKLTPLPDFQWFEVLGAIVGFLFFCALGIMSVVPAIMSWGERKFAWAHRDEMLRMNARGIAFESNEKRVEATWDEVQSVERAKNKGSFKGYLVTTKNGEFVHWANNHLFRARCESYAPAALESLRREDAALSLDSEINPTPIAADGAQKFSFRTPGNRLILLCVFSALGFAPFIYLINVYANDEPFAPSWLLFSVLCASAFLISGALYSWFARAFLIATPRELQLHSPFRSTRRIEWNSIEAAGADMWGNWIRVEGRKIYWLFVLSPARSADLRNIIEIRCGLQT